MSFDSMELCRPEHRPEGTLKAAVFDFDGTLSTLRCGWESTMRKMMLEAVSGGGTPSASLEKTVDDYIDSSAGIQTIYQMRWLAEQVEKAGLAEDGHDAWWYKDRYNDRLMEQVGARLLSLIKGEEKPERYMIVGCKHFLSALREAGIRLYLASGTDKSDVLHEAAVLGVADFFADIQGAPEREAACSKEAVLKMLLDEQGIMGEELLVVGDGRVEIALGAERGAYTLGVAADERARGGIDPTKRARLIRAGADAITGDFEHVEDIMAWLGL